ncbi:DUF1617 family protein [Paraclostridium bifermentans]|uniref:DUF1617 family protein n=1 Tax=Paraclostridium bifermentans TaxID=1490 RepID=UPI00242E082B|nr:DUF1617 family protein [Paraclostridium bifermentans]
MKLTNRQIVDDAIFLKELTQRQFPIKVSYAIAKNVSKIENELIVYNKEREKLLNKYAIKGDDGNILIDENNKLKIKDEYIDDWNKDINELLDIEIEIDIHKFKLEDLINGADSISPADLMVIDYMIEA